MVKKMKWKFVAAVMVSFFILMVIVIGGINIFTYFNVINQYDRILEILTLNDGKFPEPGQYSQKVIADFGYEFEITVESQYESRYFTVLMDEEGYINSDISHVAAISEEQAQSYAKQVIAVYERNGREKGSYKNYRYRLNFTEDGTQAIFMDMSRQLMNIASIRMISFGVMTILFILLFIITSLISNRAILPLVKNMEKQKQFITDAGHELKTPLAVISANADVLELINGGNEWIDSIRNQVTQMNELVKRLLFLSKMEEQQEFVMAEMDLSRIVREKAEQLSTIALRSDKEFVIDVQQGILYRGEQNTLETLVSVLVENAIKYCSEKGKVTVRLYKAGKIIKFEVRNTGEPIKAEEMNRLFERFYRPDASRNKKTGGHGIGLSIAKAVVTRHKGKIMVRNETGNQEENIVAFCVEL